MKEYLPALLNVMAGGGVIPISVSVDQRSSLAREKAMPVGLFVVYAGMALVVWSALRP